MVTLKDQYSKKLTQKLVSNCLIPLFLFIFPLMAFGLPTVDITLDSGNLTEANLDDGSFTVTRSNEADISAALTVYIALSGNAGNGGDYNTTNQNYVNATTRWISIPANQLSASSVITPVKDNLVEGEENILFTLQPNSLYVLGSDTDVEMSISDDVVVVSMTLDDGDMAESNQDPGKFTITRTNQGNVAAALTVYLTLAGSAGVGADYNTTVQNYVNATTRWVSIPANQLSVSSDITPVRDNLIEGDETAIFTLGSDNTQYTLGSNIVAEMTIADLVDLMFKDSFENPEP